MSQDASAGQKAVMQAIDEYTDRHSNHSSEEGPKDLKTL